MPAGRKPLPSADKRLRGNPGKRKLNHEEPQPTGAAEPPGWLSSAAREAWEEIERDLPPGLLTGPDTPAMALLCDVYAEIIAYRKQLAKLPRTKSNLDQRLKIQRVLGPMVTQFRGLASELGLTPSSRTRLKIEKPRTDAFADFMKRKDDDAQEAFDFGPN